MIKVEDGVLLLGAGVESSDDMAAYRIDDFTGQITFMKTLPIEKEQEGE